MAKNKDTKKKKGVKAPPHLEILARNTGQAIAYERMHKEKNK